MRQLIVQVPRGCGQKAFELAKAQSGTNLARFEAIGDGSEIEVVLIHISNRKVEALLEALQEIPNLQVTLVPRGVMALHPPDDQAAEQVVQVEMRSPIEVFLSGLQSVGSWKGFLAYAALSGVVVWTGLFTNTSYLLVAAMLIAPFAGPAMNLAIGTARGDRKLIRQSISRYFSALSVTVVVSYLLSVLLQQNIATTLMIEISEISSTAVLLPLAAGAAGALYLIQSERSSLVSGAAVGVLVAASLAPPTGLIGMAIALGAWQMAVSGLFVLLLQLAGINLTAALLFRGFGLSTQGARYNRGKAWITPTSLAATVVAIAGLLTWQLTDSPSLQRSSRAQRAAAEIQQLVQENPWVSPVEVNVRFTRANISGQNLY